MTKENCKDSRILKEEQLHDVIMTTINSVIEGNGNFIGRIKGEYYTIIG